MRQSWEGILGGERMPEGRRKMRQVKGVKKISGCYLTSLKDVEWAGMLKTYFLLKIAPF